MARTSGRTASIFHGLLAFPITPADPAGRVDDEELTVLLDRLRDAGVDAVGLLGSTGTYAYLERSERQRAIIAASRCLGGKVPIVVGTGDLRTDHAVRLAQDAEEAGADGLLLAPVSYTPLTEEEVFQHFKAVAHATELPVCIYNNPGTTHFTFSIPLIERLSSVRRIVALKNPAPPLPEVSREIETLRSTLPEGFSIGFSGDWNAAGALLSGADAWHSVVAGLLPTPALELARAAQAGESAKVEDLDGRLQPLWALFKELSSLRVIFAASEILGLCSRRPPRPILPLSGADYDRVAHALNALG